MLDACSLYPNKMKQSVSAAAFVVSLFDKNSSKRACSSRHFYQKIAAYLLAIMSVPSFCLGIERESYFSFLLKQLGDELISILLEEFYTLNITRKLVSISFFFLDMQVACFTKIGKQCSRDFHFIFSFLEKILEGIIRSYKIMYSKEFQGSTKSGSVAQQEVSSALEFALSSLYCII